MWFVHWCKLHWILTNVLHHLIQAWYFAYSPLGKSKKIVILHIVLLLYDDTSSPNKAKNMELEIFCHAGTRSKLLCSTKNETAFYRIPGMLTSILNLQRKINQQCREQTCLVLTILMRGNKKHNGL